jgi:hypothetical protein
LSGPIEPSADIRAAAHSVREIYLALVAEGFTAAEALKIVAEIIKGNAS